MTNLLPCPFCGSDHVELKKYTYGRVNNSTSSTYTGPTTSQVQCDNCNASIGDFILEEHAIKAWNNRYNYEIIDKLNNIKCLPDTYEKYEYGVFDVILNLHCATTGSSIPLNEDADQEYFWLKQRVENWTESFFKQKDYHLVYNEFLIKTLAISVLNAYKHSRLLVEDFDGAKSLKKE